MLVSSYYFFCNLSVRIGDSRGKDRLQKKKCDAENLYIALRYRSYLFLILH